LTMMQEFGVAGCGLFCGGGHAGDGVVAPRTRTAATAGRVAAIFMLASGNEKWFVFVGLTVRRRLRRRVAPAAVVAGARVGPTGAFGHMRERDSVQTSVLGNAWMTGDWRLVLPWEPLIRAAYADISGGFALRAVLCDRFAASCRTGQCRSRELDW
jgi:hypothetical protein